MKLFVLRLPSTPAEDAIGLTAEVWLDALESLPITWNETQDRARVRQAFRRLLRQVEKWPAPKHLVDQLGNRDPPPRALPAPKMTAEERARNSGRMAQVIAVCKKKVTGNRNPKEQQ